VGVGAGKSGDGAPSLELRFNSRAA